jgi:hypothetical protein
MPVSALHRQIAAIALRAAARHGFALAGGNALITHGMIDRYTEDVDLFTDQPSGVEDAAGAVEAVLRDAGFDVDRPDQTGGLSDIFYGMAQGLAEWQVTATGSGRERSPRCGDGSPPGRGTDRHPRRRRSRSAKWPCPNCPAASKRQPGRSSGRLAARWPCSRPVDWPTSMRYPSGSRM